MTEEARKDSIDVLTFARKLRDFAASFIDAPDMNVSQHASRLTELASKIEQGDVTPAAFQDVAGAAMSRRLTVQQAAARAGMSERSAYRDLAPLLGAKVGGKWEIPEEKLEACLRQRGRYQNLARSPLAPPLPSNDDPKEGNRNV